MTSTREFTQHRCSDQEHISSSTQHSEGSLEVRVCIPQTLVECQLYRSIQLTLCVLPSRPPHWGREEAMKTLFSTLTWKSVILCPALSPLVPPIRCRNLPEPSDSFLSGENRIPTPVLAHIPPQCAPREDMDEQALAPSLVSPSCLYCCKCLNISLSFHWTLCPLADRLSSCSAELLAPPWQICPSSIGPISTELGKPYSNPFAY